MLCVDSHGSKIYGELMWPDGGFFARHPCVLLFHGYLGAARNDDLAFALRRIGCVVATVHHRGAWGSEGSYLISNCVEDVINVYRHVWEPAFCQKYRIHPNAIFLIGHSMRATAFYRQPGSCRGSAGWYCWLPTILLGTCGQGIPKNWFP